MIDRERLLNWRFPEVEHRYGADDTMLYNLAIGFGSDPMDERQLRFVNDIGNGRPMAFPIMAVVLGYPGAWMADPATGIDYSRLVHGEETVTIHRPLGSAGDVVARHRVVAVTDKGAGKGAVITYEKELFDKADGAHVSTVRHVSFARGDGGFSGEDVRIGDSGKSPAAAVDRAPDRVIEIATMPQQALLYRLCADRNPLHSDPATASAAGFDRPILHGLCTFAIAGRAMIEGAGREPDQLRRLVARFSAPVLPGETLVFDLFDEGDTITFRAHAKERDRLVLTHGSARFGPVGG